MLHGSIEYGTTGGIVGHFVKEFQEHEHLPTKGETAWDSIKNDHTITVVNAGKCILKGAAYGFLASGISHFMKKADKRVLIDRAMFQKGFFARRFRVNAIIGALGGLTYYILHDELLCAHGKATFPRFIVVHAIMGGLTFAALWNPGAILYGAVAGTYFGFTRHEDSTRRKLPVGFELQLTNFDEEQRERAQRDREELQLSTKYRKSLHNLQNQHYIL